MTDPTFHDFAAETYRDQIANMQRAWQQWRDALQLFDDEDIATEAMIGSWAIRDVMSHIAGWDVIAIDTIAGIVSGEQHDTLETVEEINDRSVIEARHRSLDEVSSHMTLVHDQLISTIHSQVQASIEILERIEAAVCRPSCRHYLVHADELRRLAGNRP